MLLVDDAEDNRFLFTAYLKNTPCRVDLAENGLEGVQLFRQNHYDIVLMDVEMPVMDGYTATREIRKLEAAVCAAPTPVIALTAHAMADMADKAREAGFTSHLIKPIRRAVLLEALALQTQAMHAQPLQAKPLQAQPEQICAVSVEAGMEDLVPGYLDKRRGEIAKYREALERGDFEAVRMLGHKLKGTAPATGSRFLPKSVGNWSNRRWPKMPKGSARR